MRQAKFSEQHGVTAGVAMRACKATVRNQIGPEENDIQKYFYGDSWFSSVETTIQLWNRWYVHYMGVVKTNFQKNLLKKK